MDRRTNGWMNGQKNEQKSLIISLVFYRTSSPSGPLSIMEKAETTEEIMVLNIAFETRQPNPFVQ